jgi:O-antigen/teichoic acid export membrane protein
MPYYDDVIIEYNGKVIAKNTIYNLSGNIVPILFALVFVPPLIKGLGAERFGILSIAWMIVGYFSFFDFGIGRGLTKIIAEKIGQNQTGEIAKIFWTSLFIMFTVSLIVVVVLTFFVPSLAGLFKISKNFQPESRKIFYLLAFSIPIVTTMAGLRGSLEAYQKFATINLIKVILGIFTFLGPFLVLMVTNSLFWIVSFLIFTRVVIWILYFIQCLLINKSIRKEFRLDFSSIRPVLKFSIWITAANIVVPLIQYSDRFLIGTLISASALTYYVTPYEVISKLILIPDALSGVLFPVFSASFFSNPDIAKKLFLRGAKFIFLILYPIVFLIVTFSFEGIKMWLGVTFANNSFLILQFLAIGIMMNCISLIPTNFFQGIGKPKISTLIALIEFPLYVFSMWISIKHFGLNGAALTFLIATTFNVSILFIMANRLYSIRIKSVTKVFMLLPFLLGMIIPFFIRNIYFKIPFVLCFGLIFIISTWKYFLSDEEKYFISSKLKLNMKTIITK